MMNPLSFPAAYLVTGGTAPLPDLGRNFELQFLDTMDFKPEDALTVPALNRPFKTEITDEDSSTGDIFADACIAASATGSPFPASTSGTGLQVRVLGIPQNGAKSRVETQIKLCLQLVTASGEKVSSWNHLILPEHLVARERPSRQPKAEVALERSLYLEAHVVCASDNTKRVLTCFGCVQRERKRLRRRKDQGGQGDDACEDLTGADSMDPNDNIHADQQKILIFNCPGTVDFSSGDTILPTRITCYCRHHNEKIGFCICFTLRDSIGNIVAEGLSPPVLITDDHKSAKMRGAKRARTLSDDGMPESYSATPLSPLSPSAVSPGSSAAAAIAAAAGLNTLGMIPIEPTFILPKKASIAETDPIMLANAPMVARLIPAEGPIFGGIECTVLGSNFQAGNTVRFGDMDAYPTHFWGANTLLCIVPPALTPGPVTVTVKGQPTPPIPVLFTYKDDADRALMELALQVVGLKMTGKLEDARQVAMHIMDRSVNGERSTGSTTTTMGWDGVGSMVSLLAEAAHGSLPSDQFIDFESALLACAKYAMSDENGRVGDLSLQNEKRQCLLALAAFRGFPRLVRFLIQNGAELNLRDSNGYTALHFAAWRGDTQMVVDLLAAGALPDIAANTGTVAAELTCRDIAAVIIGAAVDHNELSEECDRLSHLTPEVNMDDFDGVETYATASLADIPLAMTIIAPTPIASSPGMQHTLASPLSPREFGDFSRVPSFCEHPAYQLGSLPPSPPSQSAPGTPPLSPSQAPLFFPRDDSFFITDAGAAASASSLSDDEDDDVDSEGTVEYISDDSGAGMAGAYAAELSRKSIGGASMAGTSSFFSFFSTYAAESAASERNTAKHGDTNVIDVAEGFASDADHYASEKHLKKMQRKRDRLLYNFWIPLFIVVVSLFVWAELQSTGWFGTRAQDGIPSYV